MNIVSKKFHFYSFLSLTMAILTVSCSYRFTNLYTTPPNGIKSIAIESVYDISQKAIPHEILWESVQRAFIRNGRLRVVGQNEADAYVKLTLEKFQANQLTEVILDSPNVIENEGDNKERLINPKTLKKLTRADSIADDEIQSLVVTAEIWDLNTGRILFKKQYDISSSKYKIIDNTTTIENQFLRYEEAFNNNFQLNSDKFAKRLVSDFIR